jgi:hypothetical protein
MYVCVTLYSVHTRHTLSKQTKSQARVLSQKDSKDTREYYSAVRVICSLYASPRMYRCLPVCLPRPQALVVVVVLLECVVETWRPTEREIVAESGDRPTSPLWMEMRLLLLLHGPMSLSTPTFSFPFCLVGVSVI